MRPPLDPKSRTVLVTVKMPRALLRLVNEAAKRSGVGRSKWMRAVMAEAARRAGRKER